MFVRTCIRGAQRGASGSHTSKKVGGGSRVLVFDVTCRRISITDHPLNKES